ncbi:11905_t:CDS:1, partial [Gigaspora rosea]
IFRELYIVALKHWKEWKEMNRCNQSGKELIIQMKKYKEYEPPFNIYWNDQDDVLIWWLTLDIQPNYLEKLAIKILNLKPHN